MTMLSPTQLDGCACVACGSDRNAMVPLDGIETRSSAQLFRCDRPECAVEPSEVARRIPVAARVQRRRRSA